MATQEQVLTEERIREIVREEIEIALQQHALGWRKLSGGLPNNAPIN